MILQPPFLFQRNLFLFPNNLFSHGRSRRFPASLGVGKERVLSRLAIKYSFQHLPIHKKTSSWSSAGAAGAEFSCSSPPGHPPAPSHRLLSAPRVPEPRVPGPSGARRRRFIIF